MHCQREFRVLSLRLASLENICGAQKVHRVRGVGEELGAVTLDILNHGRD
jgi:hypothetical protein